MFRRLILFRLSVTTITATRVLTILVRVHTGAVIYASTSIYTPVGQCIHIGTPSGIIDQRCINVVEVHSYIVWYEEQKVCQVIHTLAWPELLTGVQTLQNILIQYIYPLRARSVKNMAIIIWNKRRTTRHNNILTFKVLPSEHETLSWFNVRPLSMMLAQHWTNNGSMSRVC